MRFDVKHLRARLRPPGRRRSSAGIIVVVAFIAVSLGFKFASFSADGGETRSLAFGAPLEIAVPPAPRPTELVSFEQGCVSSECHAPYTADQGVHAPIKEQDCAICHEADAGDHTYALLEAADVLCAICHETGSAGSNRHEVLDNEGCLACHDAHESSAAFLLVRPSVAETCKQCHTTHEGRSQHEPYEQGRCGACHEPHESDYSALLRGGDGVEHCASCHEQVSTHMDSSIYTHNTFENGCVACHAAHASDDTPLLTSPIEKQCVSCHEDVGASMGLAVTHDAVLTDDRCLSCHDAHGSDLAKMLKDNQASLCLQCHNEPVVAADGRTEADMTQSVTDESFRHGSVVASDCSACHSVHGSEHARLLREPVAVAMTGSLDSVHYTLCFSCHDPELVLSETTIAATQFRDGDRNLHAVHIQGENGGRTCTSCHAIHTSNGPRHIAESIAYQGSDWLMAMNFKLDAEGGSCAPGCHEPLSYARSRLIEGGGGDEGESTGGDP